MAIQDQDYHEKRGKRLREAIKQAGELIQKSMREPDPGSYRVATPGGGTAWNPPPTADKQSRPKVCRECEYCSEPIVNKGIDDHAYCCCEPVPIDVHGSRIACRHGVLSVTPWPSE